MKRVIIFIAFAVISAAAIPAQAQIYKAPTEGSEEDTALARVSLDQIQMIAFLSEFPMEACYSCDAPRVITSIYLADVKATAGTKSFVGLAYAYGGWINKIWRTYVSYHVKALASGKTRDGKEVPAANFGRYFAEEIAMAIDEAESLGVPVADLRHSLDQAMKKRHIDRPE